MQFTILSASCISFRVTSGIIPALGLHQLVTPVHTYSPSDKKKLNTLFQRLPRDETQDVIQPLPQVEHGTLPVSGQGWGIPSVHEAEQNRWGRGATSWPCSASRRTSRRPSSCWRWRPAATCLGPGSIHCLWPGGIFPAGPLLSRWWVVMRWLMTLEA